MTSFTARRSMPFLPEASATRRGAAWARFLTALLRALSVSAS
jgi:hypothetical protein